MKSTFGLNYMKFLTKLVSARRYLSVNMPYIMVTIREVAEIEPKLRKISSMTGVGCNNCFLQNFKQDADGNKIHKKLDQISLDMDLESFALTQIVSNCFEISPPYE
jgi:hypothetical protein